MVIVRCIHSGNNRRGIGRSPRRSHQAKPAVVEARSTCLPSVIDATRGSIVADRNASRAPARNQFVRKSIYSSISSPANMTTAGALLSCQCTVPGSTAVVTRRRSAPRHAAPQYFQTLASKLTSTLSCKTPLPVLVSTRTPHRSTLFSTPVVVCCAGDCLCVHLTP